MVVNILKQPAYIYYIYLPIWCLRIQEAQWKTKQFVSLVILSY